MKKIGILFGQERSFATALIERVNSRNVEELIAEPVQIDKVVQGICDDYLVIVDRISHLVPFYRSYLKNAAICGTAVINNPFWWSADEKFFNNAVAVKTGVPVPRTAILPSRDIPENTTDDTFVNLAYPLDWEGIFNYVGFPAIMKPFKGGGWKNIYRVTSPDDFFIKHAETGRLVMLLQEEVAYEEYYHCFCIGGKYVHISSYDPKNPHHLRYGSHYNPAEDRLKQIREIVIRINKYLGYDFNAVEVAIRDGVPYAIDFFNPALEIKKATLGEENFEWLVDFTATYAIERALQHKPGTDNLTWGDYVTKAVIKNIL